MQLWVFEDCPYQSATYLDDKRVGKAIMENNSIMSTAIKLSGDVPESFIGEGMVCRGFSHKNHPVAIWTRQTRGNFMWVLRNTYALADEYQRRFGRHHASFERTPVIERFVGNLPAGPLQPFQNSARNGNIDFTHLPVPESYHAYLAERWSTDTRPVTFSGVPV